LVCREQSRDETDFVRAKKAAVRLGVRGTKVTPKPKNHSKFQTATVKLGEPGGCPAKKQPVDVP
jgi:hypothetical protein